MKPGGGNPHGPGLMPEQPVGGGDDPAGHRWFGVIAEIEMLAPQPILCLVNTELKRRHEKSESAQQRHSDKGDQHISVTLARLRGGGNRCSLHCAH